MDFFLLNCTEQPLKKDQVAGVTKMTSNVQLWVGKRNSEGSLSDLRMSWRMVDTIGPIACFFFACCGRMSVYLRTILLCGSRSSVGDTGAGPFDCLWIQRQTAPRFLVFVSFACFICKIFCALRFIHL